MLFYQLKNNVVSILFRFSRSFFQYADTVSYTLDFVLFVPDVTTLIFFLIFFLIYKVLFKYSL